MARRRRGRKGGHKSKAIPVAPLLPIGFVTLAAYKSQGLTSNMAAEMSRNMVGYDPLTKTFSATTATPFWLGEIAAVVIHKVANKTINKYVRKATMGYLVL